MPASFAWVEHGISESAAQGIDHAWIARMVFILFGLAVIWLARLRHRAWGPVGTAMHLTFGVSMFGVAAFPTRPWDHAAAYVENDDLLHSVFAGTIGFGFIAGVVAVMVARKLPSWRAAVPDLAALAITLSIPLFMSSDVWGALQRVMFLTAGVWYAREAWQGALDQPAQAVGEPGSDVENAPLMVQDHASAPPSSCSTADRRSGRLGPVAAGPAQAGDQRAHQQGHERRQWNPVAETHIRQDDESRLPT